jgi:ribonuclease BN (tRNA processing enzyme)
MKPGDREKVGDVEITAVQTVHSEPGGIGFVFRGMKSSKKIGYASDGVYYAGQEEHFRGCDYLILNVLRPRGKEWPKHMNTDQAAKLVELAEPKTAIITHFGMLLLKAGPWKEAKYIEEKTGIKTIAAKDGLKIADDSKGGKGNDQKPKGHDGLEKWIK